MNAPFSFEAAWPLARKVQALQDFLGERFFAPNGIMYAMWYFTDDVLRPFTRADFEHPGCSYPQTKEGITPEGHGNNENSSWTSGLFLFSQCLRYRVTGEPQALEYAAKAFRSLDLIFQLAEAAGQPGYLCKPYDGKLSAETSFDQYTCAMLGMWAYREFAPRETRARIDALLPAMADWWRERDYVRTTFGVTLNMLRYSVYTPGFALLNHLAYSVSGDPKHLLERDRILGGFGEWPTMYDECRNAIAHGIRTWPKDYEGCEYDPARAPYLLADVNEYRGGMWLTAMASATLIELGVGPVGLARNALGRHFRYLQWGLRPDLLHLYAVQVDLDRDTWHPLRRPVSPESLKKAMASWHFFAYNSEVCWGDSASRIPHVSLLAHRHAAAFSPGAIPLARKMLAALDRTRLQWMIDPDGQQLLPPDRWMQHVLSSDVPSLTLIAYWQARCYGIELG
jgi:hypothetical protein